MKRLIRGLSRTRSGLLLLTGLATVLEGVESALTTREAAPKVRRAVVRSDFFSIRRTQSELGYTYWVLQGHGRFASFALFDTWQEAMDEASRRISAEMEAAQPVAARPVPMPVAF